MWEKKRLLEQQSPGALEAMKQINREVDNLTGQAIKDLEKPPQFLYDVQQSIVKCLNIEKKAFQALNTII